MFRGHIAAADFAGENCSVGGAVPPGCTFIVARMIRRTSNRWTGYGEAAASESAEMPEDFYRQKLKEALGEGVEALNDPEIEAKVEAYFRGNPSFSRDAVHVAAVACQFKREKVIAARQQETASRQETVFRSLTL
ncbi:MAG: hypothetical protein ABIP85_05595 [Chthoniobacteraceae bacterium]